MNLAISGAKQKPFRLNVTELCLRCKWSFVQRIHCCILALWCLEMFHHKNMVFTNCMFANTIFLAMKHFKTQTDSDKFDKMCWNYFGIMGKPCFFLSFHIEISAFHDDVIKWKYFLIFSLICAWMNGWDNHREAGDFRRHRAYYDGTVMF